MSGIGETACLGDTVLLADVGNTRIKLASVERYEESGLPILVRRADLQSRSFHPTNLDEWLRAAAPGSAVVLVASVHDAAAARLEAAVAERAASRHRPLRQRRVRAADLPLKVAVDEPEKVGIDRLAAAAAGNRLRRRGHAAVIVDCGTAVTVDLISSDGVFLGGSILPGAALMARALAEGTSKLPELETVDQMKPPAMPGRSTSEAIAAGIGWGIRGAVARLVEEARRSLGDRCDTLLTGGARAIVRGELPDVVELPDLVLSGIALAARAACAR